MSAREQSDFMGFFRSGSRFACIVIGLLVISLMSAPAASAATAPSVGPPNGELQNVNCVGRWGTPERKSADSQTNEGQEKVTTLAELEDAYDTYNSLEGQYVTPNKEIAQYETAFLTNPARGGDSAAAGFWVGLFFFALGLLVDKALDPGEVDWPTRDWYVECDATVHVRAECSGSVALEPRECLVRKNQGSSGETWVDVEESRCGYNELQAEPHALPKYVTSCPMVWNHPHEQVTQTGTFTGSSRGLPLAHPSVQFKTGMTEIRNRPQADYYGAVSTAEDIGGNEGNHRSVYVEPVFNQRISWEPLTWSKKDKQCASYQYETQCWLEVTEYSYDPHTGTTSHQTNKCFFTVENSCNLNEALEGIPGPSPCETDCDGTGIVIEPEDELERQGVCAQCAIDELKKQIPSNQAILDKVDEVRQEVEGHVPSEQEVLDRIDEEKQKVSPGCDEDCDGTGIVVPGPEEVLGCNLPCDLTPDNPIDPSPCERDCDGTGVVVPGPDDLCNTCVDDVGWIIKFVRGLVNEVCPQKSCIEETGWADMLQARAESDDGSDHQ